MPPDFEDLTRTVVSLFVTWAGSKVVVMNEDADDSWCWRILVDTIVASTEHFEMSMVVDDDANNGVYWVIENAIGVWLPAFNCAFINTVKLI